MVGCIVITLKEKAKKVIGDPNTMLNERNFTVLQSNMYNLSSELLEIIDFSSYMNIFKGHSTTLHWEYVMMADKMIYTNVEANYIVSDYNANMCPPIKVAFFDYLAELDKVLHRIEGLDTVKLNSFFTKGPHLLTSYADKNAYLIVYLAKFNLFLDHLRPHMTPGEIQIMENSKHTLHSLLKQLDVWHKNKLALSQDIDGYLNFKHNAIQNAVHKLVEDTRPFN